MAVGVSTVSDASLVEAVKQGDARAFSELYATHVGAVTTVVRANFADRDEMADVVQGVFCRALEQLGSLREPGLFRPWLLSIARHRAVDERRRRTRVAPARDDVIDDVPSPRVGPDEHAELAELARLVNGNVGGLSRRDATALSLVIHLGYTPAQVAAVLGVTPGAAKVILHRARIRLRDVVALEVLVRSRSTACVEFASLSREDDPIGALRHVRGCDVCLDAATQEVELYDAAPAAGDDSGSAESDDPNPLGPERVRQR